MKKIIELNEIDCKGIIENVIRTLNESSGDINKRFGIDLSDNEYSEAIMSLKNGLTEDNDGSMYIELFGEDGDIDVILDDIVKDISTSGEYVFNSPKYGDIRIEVLQDGEEDGVYMYEVTIFHGNSYNQEILGGITKTSRNSGRAISGQEDFDGYDIDFWEIGRFIALSLNKIVNEGINEGISEGINERKNSMFIFGINMEKDEAISILNRFRNELIVNGIYDVLNGFVNTSVYYEIIIKEMINSIANEGSYTIHSNRFGDITIFIDLTEDDITFNYMYLVYFKDSKGRIISDKNFVDEYDDNSEVFKYISKYIINVLSNIKDKTECKHGKKIIVNEMFFENVIMQNVISESMYGEDEIDDDDSYFTADECYDGFVDNKGEEVLRYLYGTKMYNDYDIDYEELVNNYETALENTKYGTITIKLNIGIGSITVYAFSENGFASKCYSTDLTGYGLGKCVSKALENMIKKL